ncbi:hypothetical protein C2S51_001801 [Perilla frutescens var. frutescens]|nr:hypothetical protein C2S51_001801 [Perilla frutescens var. frutescens]
MALDAFLDSDCQPMILPCNGSEGILEALISNSSLKNEEHFDSILSMARLSPNLGSDVLNSTILGRSSASRFGAGHDSAIALANLTLPAGNYLQSHSNTSFEPYISLPTPFSSDGPVNVSYNGDMFSHLCQTRENESKKQKLENAIRSADSCKTRGLNNQNSLPVRRKQESSILAPVLKKPRLDDNQGNIQQQQQEQEIIHELVLKELQDCNPHLKAMMKQHRPQTQLQQQILQSTPQLRGFHLQLPKQQMRVLLHDQGNQHESFAPLLDGGICSYRLKQYLHHLRNNRHDNDISYWTKFVSEYYAPGSKKRWCFSKYENIELHTAGVFCPKSMETYCCQICGLKSGKGLEATDEIFPRLFKMKFDSGMLDEILYIDSPRACKVPNGLVLEYGKAIQVSVYETFRVVHKGKLRVVFRHDLKILSWEFCIENHEEYLLRSLFTPQVKQLVQAVEKYQDIQNYASSRASLLDLRKVCDMCVSTGMQIGRNMELPLVNDLGYPKRFIRCLQIAEVVDSMKDLMEFSQDTTMGAVECLNNYSRGSKIGNQMTGNQGMVLAIDEQNSPTFHEQPGYGLHANGSLMTENGAISGSESSGLVLFNYNHQFLGKNSSAAASTRRKGQGSATMDNSNQNQAVAFVQSFNSPTSLLRSQSSECSEISHQALVDKMLHEMLLAASSRGKSAPENCRRPDNEAALQLNQTRATSKRLRHSESLSPNAATVQVNSMNVSAGTSSKVAFHCSGRTSLTVKAEPCSPDLLPEAFQSSAACFSKLEGFGW